MISHRMFFLGLGLLTLVSGCAKDRTIEDYENEKIREKNLKVAEVAGEYQGLIYDTDRSLLGNLMIRIDPQSRISSSADKGLARAEQAIFTKLIYDGDYVSEVDTESAFYDAEKGTFLADFTISSAGESTPNQSGSGTSSSSRKISLSVTISGNRMTGFLYASSYRYEGKWIDLTRGAPAADRAQLRNGNASETSQLRGVHRFITEAPPSKPLPPRPEVLLPLPPEEAAPKEYVELSIIANDKTPAAKLFNLVSPMTMFSVTYRARNLQTFRSDQVVFDTRYNGFETTLREPRLSAAIELKCRQLQKGSWNAGWVCQVDYLNERYMTDAVFLPMPSGNGNGKDHPKKP